MKTILLITAILFLSLNSCTKKEKIKDENKIVIDASQSGKVNEHNAKNSLDYLGMYEGILPCADCEGIETKLILKQDNKYILQTFYLGKKEALPLVVSGSYNWDELGNIVILSGVENAPNQYFVSENYIIQLDMQGNKITGVLAEKYILKKNLEFDDTKVILDATESVKVKSIDKTPIINGIRWKLIELNGKKIEQKEKMDKDMFILFNNDNRYNAFAGCNSMTGGFELKEETMQIKFTKGVSTMMACPNMTTEQEFAEMLEKVDNYSINGNNLSFNKARMAPLARFEAMK